jgi:hypothetical protein
MWNKIAKPNNANWQKVSNDPYLQPNPGGFGFSEFGVNNFGQGSDVQPDNWVKKAKPTSSSWNKVAKPLT